MLAMMPPLSAFSLFGGGLSALSSCGGLLSFGLVQAARAILAALTRLGGALLQPFPLF
jgi:hypothetical protein